MDPKNISLQESVDSSRDEAEIPKRSSLWFSGRTSVNLTGALFDRITCVFAICLALFSFVIFWPIVSQINFEEAFFTPFVPFLISILSAFGLTQNEALRVLFIASFMVSTVGVYLLVRDLTKRQVTAILAAVGFLVPPIPIFVLTYVRRGLFEVELASAKSFFSVIYGDGAHFLALALIPYAICVFLRYLKSGQKFYLALTVVLVGFIFLSNRSQAFYLSLILTITYLTDSFLGVARLKAKRFLLVIIFSVGLVSIWYTPAFWFESINVFAQIGLVNFKFLFPLPFLLSVFGLFFSFVYFARREDRQPIFIAFLTFITFLVIAFQWLMSGKSGVPHPHRVLPNINMFGAIICALTLTAIVDDLKIVSKLGLNRWSSSAHTLAALGFGIASFVILTIGAYLLSPLAILAVSGPSGIWTQIRLNVLADRQQTLDLAGGNFNLIHLNAGWLQVNLGLVVSVIFAIIFLFYLAKSEEADEG